MGLQGLVGTPLASDPLRSPKRLRLPWGGILVFLLFWGLYAATGCWRFNGLNAHVHLAYAMLHGSFALIDPPQYFELAHYQGRSYVAYGIAPSLLMLPGVAIWGLSFHQALFNAALGAAAVALWWSTLGHMGASRAKQVVLTAMLGLGSLYWYYSGHDGNTWSLMHVSTVFGLMVALREVYGRQRGWLAGLGFGIAVLSRQPVFLALPFFLAGLWRDDRASGGASIPRKIGSFGLMLGALMGFNAFYNFARFGHLLNNGYKQVILETTQPQYLKWGLFHLNYLPQNLYGYFLKLPAQLPGFPFFDPGLDGFTILLSLPALVLVLGADFRRWDTLLALLSIVGILGFYLVYYWSGFSQFGRRYSVDVLPFMLVLIANSALKRRTALVAALTALGVLVEVWGLYWFRLKGW